MRGEPDHDQHAKDRQFLAWIRVALTADLVAKWWALMDIAWLPDRWMLRAIERELERRGEAHPEDRADFLDYPKIV